MAFTYKTLKGLGLEEDKIDLIMEAHNEVVQSLKTDKDSYKKQAEEADSLRAELEKANDTIKSLGSNDFQQRYEKEKADFEAYKSEIAKKEETEAKRTAYKGLLKNAGVLEGKLDTVLRLANLDDLTIKDGKFEGEDKLLEAIKEEWKDLIVQSNTKGANTTTPPNNSGHKMTKEEIMKIKDTTARQKAISENLELFGH